MEPTGTESAAISRARLKGGWCKATIAGITVKGPAWCLSLAEPAQSRS
jgi:hypothetical protein